MKTSPQADSPSATNDCPGPADLRVGAFTNFLLAVDTGDWRLGLEATRQLRQPGLSVALVPKPSDDRRPV